MLSPPSSKKLSSMPTRSTPSTSANSPHSTASCAVRAARCCRSDEPRSGAGSARRSSLPFGVSGSRSSTTNADGTMWSGSAADSASAKLRNVDRSTGRRHHIAHQPLAAARRRLVVAHHDRGRRHTRLPHQQRLDLARLDPEAAKLHLLVRAAQELQHAVGTPPRQVPGPVHPRPGRTMRVRDKPLRASDPRDADNPRARPKPRDVKLANNTRRNRLKTGVQNIDPIVRKRTADRDANRKTLFFSKDDARSTKRALGRTVFVDQRDRLGKADNAAPPTLSEHDFAGNDHRLQFDLLQVSDLIDQSAVQRRHCEERIDLVASDSRYDRRPPKARGVNTSAPPLKRLQNIPAIELSNAIDDNSRKRGVGQIGVNRSTAPNSLQRSRDARRRRLLAFRSSPRCRSHRRGGAGRGADGGRGRGLPRDHRPVGIEPHHVAAGARPSRGSRSSSACWVTSTGAPASASMKASRSRG